ncbi:MAG: hypothetical protein WC807_18585 [Hyphomicrobium sp.]
MSPSTKYVLVGSLVGMWGGIIAYEIRHGGIVAAFIRGLLGR